MPAAALSIGMGVQRGMALTVTLSSDTPAVDAVPHRILVVEDEVLVRMMLTEELRGHGYTVLEAVNADEARAILQSVDIDLLLTDIQMPGRIDGLELVQQLSHIRPELKVLILSAHPPGARAFANVAGSFQKPFEVEQLVRHIRAILA